MNQFFLCSLFSTRGFRCVVDWTDSRGKCGDELCVYFVLYFSRLGGFQDERSVDWADSKSRVVYIFRVVVL